MNYEILDKATNYYLNNRDNFIKTASIFNIERKSFSKYVKEKFPNYKGIKLGNVLKKLHNFNYDFSLVNNYKDNTDFIKIICPIHGLFEEKIAYLIGGCGCKKCKENNKLQDFIEKANKIHNFKYDYSKSSFGKYKDEICIICPKHGEFWQKLGDKVFPCGNGRCLDDGSWILHYIEYDKYHYTGFKTDFPNEPHTILNLHYSDSKPYEVHTDKGFSPKEVYYKIIKKEQQVEEIKHGWKTYKWAEI